MKEEEIWITTDGMFCAQCLSQYQEILSKTRLFGTRNCSKLGRSLYIGSTHSQSLNPGTSLGPCKIVFIILPTLQSMYIDCNITYVQ